MASENAFPYTPVPKRMEELLNRLPTIGRPPKASQEWLQGLGFTSSNDRRILAVLRQLGVINSSGEPTDFYDAIRSQNGPKVAEHVRAAYKELFDVYPDAERRDAEALQSFFRAKAGTGKAAQRYMVRTFQTLCKFGDFERERSTQRSIPASQVPSSEPERAGGTRIATTRSGLTLNVNIQLQLPDSADGEVYEKLFEAMARHLNVFGAVE